MLSCLNKPTKLMPLAWSALPVVRDGCAVVLGSSVVDLRGELPVLDDTTAGGAQVH